MARIKLTKRALDAARVPRDGERPYFLWDSELRGFGVTVAPSGKRSFCVDYVTVGGTRKRMVIGAYGALTCDEARTLAKVHLGNVARGEDPASDRKTKRKAMTVGQLCDQYLADAERGLIRGRGRDRKKESTLTIDKGRISRHIKPLIGSTRVIDLRPVDINRFFKDVSTGKTAKTYRNPGSVTGNARVTGGEGTARRTVGLLGAILAYAVTEGTIDSNPARGVKKGQDGQRIRRLTPDEYRRLGAALTAAEEAGEHWQVVAAVRLLALTGCRLGEIRKLTWDEVDATGQAVRLKDSKTGPSVRPSGKPVFEVLDKLPSKAAGRHVFPSARKADRVFASMAAGVLRIMERAKLDGVTAHTLRHSYASVAADLGFAEPTIAALLGHSAGGVTGRYIHHLDSVLTAAADKVSREIWRQLTGEQGNVYSFPGVGRQAG